MSRKIFIEDVADAAVQMVIDNLNTQITEINTERADFDLKLLNTDNGIVFQSFNEKVLNFDPILFYSINGSQTIDPRPSAHAATWEIEFSLVIKDVADGEKRIPKRLFRYQRALREIFQKEYITVGNTRRRVAVRNLDPVAFTLQNNSQEFRAIGIVLETTLAD